MQISERDLLNYIKCPLYYQIEATGQNLKRDTYNSLIHDVANEYINRVGAIPLLGEFNHEKYLKKKWDNVCLTNQHLITPKQTIQGWGCLYRLIELLTNPYITVLDTEMTYKIEPIGSKHSLQGHLDPIIKQGDFYTTLVISFSDKLPESYVMDMNLKHTIDSYALNQLIPGIQHVTTYYSLKSGQEKDTLRFDSHHKRLESILNTVGDCIEQQLIYPRNSYSCSTCNLRGLCDRWEGGKK
jgi:hypothetical protein